MLPRMSMSLRTIQRLHDILIVAIVLILLEEEHRCSSPLRLRGQIRDRKVIQGESFEVAVEMRRYFRFYNGQRLHEALDYRTPERVYREARKAA